MAMTKEARRLVRLRKAENNLCGTEGCHEAQVAGKKKCQKHLTRDAENARKRNEKSIAKGKCPRCKKREPLPDRKYCDVCLKECNDKTKENYRKDPSKQRIASAKWRTDKLGGKICTQCGDRRARPDAEHCEECTADQAYRERLRRTERRRLVLAHYGRICVCCGESEIDLLEVDHTAGGGTRHLKEIGRGNLYKWLIDNNYPTGFQVLCGSCNHAWGRLRCCPHAKDRLVEVVVDGVVRLRDPKTNKFAKPDYPEPVAVGVKARRKLKKQGA